MSKLLFKSVLSLAILLSVFCAPFALIRSNAAYSSPSTVSIQKPGYGYVSVSSGTLNVRQAPSTTSSIITSLPKDSAIMIVGKEGQYYKIQYDKYGHYGYVSSSYVEFAQSSYYLKVKNITGTLNMREYAEPDATIVAHLSSGTYLAHMYDVTVTSFYCGLYGNQVGAVHMSYVDKYAY